MTVYDVCDSYTFYSAPVLSPNNAGYSTGQGDLAIQAIYPDPYECGTFSIEVQFDSDASTIEGDPLDSSQTYLEVVDATNLNFFSNQPNFSGTLKYNIRIDSSAVANPSPIAVWTISI